MKINNKHARWGIPTLGIAAAFALIAWAGNPQESASYQQLSRDTIPSKSNKATREAGDKDLDKEIRRLDEAKERLKEVDWDHIKKSLEEVRNNLHAEQLQQQIEEAMKQVDMEKINREIQESLRKVDMEKMQKEVNESLKQAYAGIDQEALKKQMDEVKLKIEKEINSQDWKKEMEAIKKIDLTEMREEMEKAKVDMEKALEELKQEKFDFEANRNNAWQEIDKAKEAFKGYQEMIYSLEKEGLLSTKNDYTIQYKDGELTVNGKKQPQEVANRYKKFFKHDTVTIRKEKGDMDVDID